MSIQLYFNKRNFDVQKAERFLKERRMAFQSISLAKHKLGQREVELFARGAGGARNLLDLADIKVKSHPAAYTNDKNNILTYILENPSLLRSPILRRGNDILIGFDEEGLTRWTTSEETRRTP